MWKRLLSVIVIVFTVIAIVPMTIQSAEQEHESKYIPHSPIRINGNGDFPAIASSGDGGPLTPWIIEGWDINGTGFGNCIYIGNTTENFIVENCYLYDAGNGIWEPPHNTLSGLALYNITKGKILNNTFSLSQRYGLYLSYANDNGIYNNTFTNDTSTEIYSTNSHNNTIQFNLVQDYDNWERTLILMSYSNSNIIKNNTMFSKYPMKDTSILLQYSKNNVLINNTMINNGLSFAGSSVLSNWNTHTIDSSNTINGRPIQYLKNQTGLKVPLGAGQVILANCTNVIIENQEFNNCSLGISIGFSNGIIIANNSADYNGAGFALRRSNANTIINNSVNNNDGIGLYFSYSNGNNITKNSALNNFNVGYYISHSEYNNITNNTGSITLSSSSNNFIYKNNASYERGIYIARSNGNSIINNNASNCGRGIRISYSENNIVANNNFSYNPYYEGIYFYYSSRNIIKNNTMIDNGIFFLGDTLDHWNTHIIDTFNTVNGKPVYYWKNQTGGTVPTDAGQVILANCTDVIVENQIINNGTVGIQLGYSQDNKLRNNTLGYNARQGLDLYSSSNNKIVNNTISYNDKSGVFLSLSNGNTLTYNTIDVNDGYGINIDRSNGNNVNINTISSNNFFGIADFGSTNTTISNNNISGNYYGICLQDSFYANVTENNIWNSVDAGVGLLQSEYNTIFKNAIFGNYIGIVLSVASNNSVYSNSVGSNTAFGFYLVSSNSNSLYHNNITNNPDQARDDGNNQWDEGYPLGGNYWDDYNGVDLMSGPEQDQPDSDGVGDTNYTSIIDGPNVDNYPLMMPDGSRNKTISLLEGWNLISIPFEQSDESIDQVLSSIAGKWDYIRTYDTLSPEPWKSNCTYKPDQLNDFNTLNHKQGFWINITEPNVNLTVTGNIASSASINLYAGWNLVGYPTLNDTEMVGVAFFGTGADKAMVCNISEPYHIKEVGPTYVMKPGEGYWVHVVADSVWVVNW